MAGRDKIPAPIDRPLVSAYVRGFDGWSTAYPPELSSPTTLRKMENLWVTPESALKIRPGLRSIFTESYWLSDDEESIVGGFEHFMATVDLKGILLAVRTNDGSIRFRTFIENETTGRFDPDNSFPGLDDVVLPEAVQFVKYLQIDNKILALPSDTNFGAVLFFVGASKGVKIIPPEGLSIPEWDDVLTVVHPEAAWINTTTKVTIPTAETPVAGEDGTLISATTDDNKWTFGYYYTFETEFGESAASDVTLVRTQFGWSQWRPYVPDTDGSQTSTIVSKPEMAMDQLVAILPAGLYAAAKLAGAIKWNLYMFTWSDTSAIPSTGILVAQRPITGAGTVDTEGWVQNTLAAPSDSYVTPIPSEENRQNYSGSPTAMQGLVAGDRLILVNDERGRIIWTSNQPGEYTNFTPTKGGGAKTLSAGNLEIPINAQLWQNPQAVDTITILCAGLDGYHSAYYMAPASVSGQSDSTLIMGFEETTATPGTTSPYGVEVHNNGLYHPLEQALMKSTAQNYVISHKVMTDDVANMWRRLIKKEKIVSSQLGDYLYYIVHNPLGEELQSGCSGNEIWVLNPTKDGPIWSRWLIQGVALRRIEIQNYLYMSVVTPEAIFILDPYSYADEQVGEETTNHVPIPWKFETNTLGANSRHDVQVHLQRAVLSLGDWVGQLKWGVRGWDGDGRLMDTWKIFQDVQDGITLPTTTFEIDQSLDLGDTSSILQLQRKITEWTLYAESVPDEFSYGQIDMARFQFVQTSVNVGYELGSIQSFEYARNVAAGNDFITQNGIPRPIQDPRRP